ncbi:MAG: hypothetical protein M3164_01110 [Actinomycetota bacterium]|nr:hypothetical protein [Actinomycetota bacterium]
MEVILLKARVRPALGVIAVFAAVAFAAAACQPARNTERLAAIESSVKGVNDIATRVRTLEGKEQGTAGQVSSLTESVAELNESVDALRKEIQAAQGAETALKKKVDAVAAQASSVSGKLGSLEQKISLLETRYNDHLRKYHSGG